MVSKVMNMNVEKMATMVFALVENYPILDDEILGYAEACEMLALSESETAAVCAFIENDLRFA